MKKLATLHTLQECLDRVCDIRLVFLGLGLIGLASCSSETQGSASSPLLGVYVQVDRVARPGIKEIFENYADRETSNRNSPSSDTTLPAAVVNFIAANAAGAPSTSVKNLFTPDELQANLDVASGSYLDIELGKNTFGGRNISDPAMEADLSAVFGSLLGGGPTKPCLATDGLSAPSAGLSATFPYLN